MNKQVNSIYQFHRYSAEFQELTKHFNCGNIVIDNFLKGNESLEPDICQSYIMVETKVVNHIERQKIIGFYPISADTVISNLSISINCPILDGGAIRIRMFAVDKAYQKKKIRIDNEVKTYASLLLSHCIETIENLTNQHVGAMYMVLDSTLEGRFLYSKTGGFEKLNDIDDICLTHIIENGECTPMYRYIREE